MASSFVEHENVAIYSYTDEIWAKEYVWKLEEYNKEIRKFIFTWNGPYMYTVYRDSSSYL
jgi:hypothetical protein